MTTETIMALADAYAETTALFPTHDNATFQSMCGKSRAVLHSAIEALVRDAEMIRTALEGVMPWVVTQEFACHGMKCREALCQSCNYETEKAAENACAAAAVAYAAIAAQEVKLKNVDKEPPSLD